MDCAAKIVIRARRRGPYLLTHLHRAELDHAPDHERAEGVSPHLLTFHGCKHRAHHLSRAELNQSENPTWVIFAGALAILLGLWLLS